MSACSLARCPLASQPQRESLGSSQKPYQAVLSVAGDVARYPQSIWVLNEVVIEGEESERSSLG